MCVGKSPAHNGWDETIRDRLPDVVAPLPVKVARIALLNWSADRTIVPSDRPLFCPELVGNARAGTAGAGFPLMTAACIRAVAAASGHGIGRA